MCSLLWLQMLYINAYICNLEKWNWWIYLQRRSGDTDVWNGLGHIYSLSLFFKGGHLFLNRELYTNYYLLSFSHSVVSNSLRPHGLQHARLHCPSPSPRAHSILHHLPELIQTHVYWVSDAIQPSDPLSSPFLPAFNLNQHQGLC